MAHKVHISSPELPPVLSFGFFLAGWKSWSDLLQGLVVLETSLLTAYIGIFTFFKINEKLNSSHINEYLIIILLIWLLSVICSSLAFAPFKDKIDLNCVTEIEEVLYKISDRKQRYLLIGFILFIASILLSIGVLWFGSHSSSGIV